MKRLTICAYGAFILISTSAVAEDAQTGLADAGSGPVLLGQDKVAPLCPEYCALRRVTSPELASVGEREVLAYALEAAATGAKLRIDSGRSAWAQAEKFPRAVSYDEPLNTVTQNEFRPALDPVLAEPTTNNTE